MFTKIRTTVFMFLNECGLMWRGTATLNSGPFAAGGLFLSQRACQPEEGCRVWLGTPPIVLLPSLGQGSLI